MIAGLHDPPSSIQPVNRAGGRSARSRCGRAKRLRLSNRTHLVRGNAGARSKPPGRPLHCTPVGRCLPRHREGCAGRAATTSRSRASAQGAEQLRALRFKPLASFNGGRHLGALRIGLVQDTGEWNMKVERSSHPGAGASCARTIRPPCSRMPAVSLPRCVGWPRPASPRTAGASSHEPAGPDPPTSRRSRPTPLLSGTLSG